MRLIPLAGASGSGNGNGNAFFRAAARRASGCVRRSAWFFHSCHRRPRRCGSLKALRRAVIRPRCLPRHVTWRIGEKVLQTPFRKNVRKHSQGAPVSRCPRNWARRCGRARIDYVPLKYCQYWDVLE